MKTLLERIEEKVERLPESGCWIWIGGTNGRGYGQLQNGGEKHYVHRLAYALLVGPIPQGLHIDHLCRVRSCCNPAHLEPVTCRENNIRSESPEATRKRHAAITNCPKGHPYEADAVRKNGNRYCRECNRIRTRANMYWKRGNQ